MVYRKRTYKLYSALGSNGNIFSINLALLTELCQKCEVFDKNFKISDTDLALKASKFSINQVTTAYGLIRHEFLEFLVRVSIDKYYRSGFFSDEIEAVEYFFEKNFIKFSQIYDPDKWRSDRYFTQECEEILIENKGLLQNIFDQNSGKKAKPGEKKYMRLEDFIGICQTNGLFTEMFNLRQGTLCFHMSLLTHVDELNTNFHMEASRLEFIEALARVADFNESSDPERDMLSNIYPTQDLHEKLKNILSMFSRIQNSKRIKTRNTFT